jgi:hypothetical protein
LPKVYVICVATHVGLGCRTEMPVIRVVQIEVAGDAS